jgi:hypothetical protein
MTQRRFLCSFNSLIKMSDFIILLVLALQCLRLVAENDRPWVAAAADLIVLKGVVAAGQ